ncbi:DUF983 domain-containing protein [Methylovirgula sp. HY1]|uniref:DUF983 domain-containing protein n=1 Tax=Methylovirgula sp. HY1 TaxID=2822761 RepID=UPI001C5BC4AE|nr:DUF983 domain-containing protein [Methylovirgula sp. HY1]QXX74156.1 hypothetical protein MHY1_00964 [Methylovirgula sp. HY1]
MNVEFSSAPFGGLASDEPAAKPTRNIWQSVKRGLAGKCPNCGTGKLFYRYLKVSDRCPECGEEFFHHRADDAPPYLTILVTAHIVGTGMVATSSIAPDLPLIYQMTIWPALTLVLSLILLPIFKGGLIAHQWALRMHGFETAAATVRIPADP